MTMPWRPDRDEVVALLATFGNRDPAEVPEQIGSLELAWLVHQIEQRQGIQLDLSDEELIGMGTVTNAVTVLGRSLSIGAASDVGAG